MTDAKSLKIAWLMGIIDAVHSSSVENSDAAETCARIIELNELA